MNNKLLGVATPLMVMDIVISVILLFAGIGLLVIIHACIVGRTFRRGIGNGSMIEGGITGSTSISQDDLEKLPCYDYIARSKGSSPVDCSICLDNFKMGDKCRLLPICNHSFHAQCVDAWLLKNPICPICRASADSQKARLIVGEESSHLSDTSVELRWSQTTESGHFNDVSIELRETISSHLSAIRIEVIESQITESSHSGDVGIEFRDNQTNVAGTQLSSSDPSHLPVPASESTV